MNIRNIALVAGLVAIAGVANAQVFELRAGAGVQGISGNTISVNATGPFTVQIWAVLPSARTATSLAATLGYAWSTSTANGTTQATDSNNRLGTVSYANVQALIPGVGTPIFRRAVASGTTNFTAGPAGTTGVNGIYQGYSSGVTPAAFSGAIHIGNVTFTSHNLANNEIYGDDANEFGLQLLANGSTSAPTTAGFSGFGGGTGPLSSGSIRYRVQAVPEPATMAALGLGLAAMARRRRNKK